MSYKQNDGKQPMTPKQKTAAIVCAVCALALVLTISVTGVLVSKKMKANEADSESQIAVQDGYDGSAYVLDSGAVLEQTADAGAAYVSDTLFLGDSNTLRLYNNGMATLQQVCAEEGLGIQDAATKKIVAFKGDSELYTYPAAVAMLKPRRVVITLGTNNSDGSLDTAAFIANYRTLVTAIQSAYAYTDIIINAIPPVPAQHSKYADADQGAIDAYNIALADLCEELNCKFLNSAQALKDSNGYGTSSYYVENDIHLTRSGLQAFLDYYRTHAYDTQDRRPDTSNIPTRVLTGASSGGTVTATPTPTAAALFTASYLIDSNGGGTLSAGQETGKSTLSFEILDVKQSITVTAVPNQGYIFSQWSDGNTNAARTDTNFSRNINVTAVFQKITLALSPSSAATIEAGKSLSFTATAKIGSKEGNVNGIRWYVADANGSILDNSKTGTSFTFTPSAAGSYSIYVVYAYGGVDVATSAITPVTVTAAPTPSPSPTATPVLTPSPAPEATPSPEPTATPPVAEPTPDAAASVAQ